MNPRQDDHDREVKRVEDPEDGAEPEPGERVEDVPEHRVGHGSGIVQPEKDLERVGRILPELQIPVLEMLGEGVREDDQKLRGLREEEYPPEPGAEGAPRDHRMPRQNLMLRPMNIERSRADPPR